MFGDWFGLVLGWRLHGIAGHALVAEDVNSTHKVAKLHRLLRIFYAPIQLAKARLVHLQQEVLAALCHGFSVYRDKLRQLRTASRRNVRFPAQYRASGKPKLVTRRFVSVQFRIREHGGHLSVADGFARALGALLGHDYLRTSPSLASPRRYPGRSTRRPRNTIRI